MSFCPSASVYELEKDFSQRYALVFLLNADLALCKELVNLQSQKKPGN